MVPFWSPSAASTSADGRQLARAHAGHLFAHRGDEGGVVRHSGYSLDVNVWLATGQPALRRDRLVPAPPSTCATTGWRISPGSETPTLRRTRRACPEFPTRPVGSVPVTSRWNRSNSRSDLLRGSCPSPPGHQRRRRLARWRSPAPWKLTSLITSPSSRSQTVTWSPQSGLCPSAWRSASVDRPIVPGRPVVLQDDVLVQLAQARHQANTFRTRSQPAHQRVDLVRACCRRRTRRAPSPGPRTAA